MKTEISKFFSWSKSDAVKTFIRFIIGSVVSLVGDAIMQAFINHNYSIDSIHWKEIGAALVVLVITELKKRFLTNSNGEFLKKEAPKQDA